MRDESSAVASVDDLKSRSKDVAWYQPKLGVIQSAARELFEKYSGIAPENLEDHVCAIREKAWDIFPYPCIGGWRFINLNLCTTKQYAEILQGLKNGEKLLDLGCCFGQEMRRLIYDGAPSQNLVCVDLRPEFFELGYEMFRDREKCKSKFMATNIFEPSEELERMYGAFSVVYAGAFFHLFDRPEQIEVAKRVVSLLSPAPGSMLLGRQVGNINAGRYDHATNKSGYMYRHNEQSWQELWDEIGRATDSQWKTRAELRESARFGQDGWSSDGARQMHFCVTRV